MITDFNEALEFEKKSKIFYIKNDFGIYLWDIFRFFVWDNIMYDSLEKLNVVSKKNIKNYLKKILKFILYFWQTFFIFFLSRKKYNNLFIFFSRNRYKESFVDQNLFDTYRLLKNENNLLFETSYRRNYKYYKKKIFYVENIKSFLRIIYHKKLSFSDRECIHNIYQLLIDYFSELNFTETNLEQILINFYEDMYLYERIIKNHKIKRIMVTQNGIQKGLFYIAKKLKIPILEFQHGIIDRGHFAYSYPEIENIKNLIYIPSKYLTFSDYWCESFFCPIKNVSIGNNYFSRPVIKLPEAEKILVISANVFGHALAKIIMEGIENGKLKADEIIFKLHPNQFFEKQYFIDYFQNKVLVLTDEKSVNELLCESRCMITVCSTAAYEALQCQTRVLVYAVSLYKEMELLFDDKNLFVFHNIYDLEEGIKAELPESYKAPIFFDKCTPEKIKAALAINE